jgi:hypothetical protein
MQNEKRNNRPGHDQRARRNQGGRVHCAQHPIAPRAEHQQGTTDPRNRKQGLLRGHHSKGQSGSGESQPPPNLCKFPLNPECRNQH